MIVMKIRAHQEEIPQSYLDKNTTVLKNLNLNSAVINIYAFVMKKI